jgi:hypothetical protein
MKGTSEQHAIDRFPIDIKGHQIEVIKSDGLHRHLRFKRLDTNAYYFDIVTWPGSLCFTGDMGTLVFQRLEDMFEFFRDDKGRINPSYWAEKVQAGVTKKYCKDRFKELITDRFDSMKEDLSTSESSELWDEICEDVLRYDKTEQEAHEAAKNFNFKGFTFGDSWELNFKDYTFHYVWACLAIAWAIKAFDERNEVKNEHA